MGPAPGRGLARTAPCHLPAFSYRRYSFPGVGHLSASASRRISGRSAGGDGRHGIDGLDPGPDRGHETSAVWLLRNLLARSGGREKDALPRKFNYASLLKLKQKIPI